MNFTRFFILTIFIICGFSYVICDTDSADRGQLVFVHIVSIFSLSFMCVISGYWILLSDLFTSFSIWFWSLLKMLKSNSFFIVFVHFRYIVMEIERPSIHIQMIHINDRNIGTKDSVKWQRLVAYSIHFRFYFQVC